MKNIGLTLFLALSLSINSLTSSATSINVQNKTDDKTDINTLSEGIIQYNKTIINGVEQSIEMMNSFTVTPSFSIQRNGENITQVKVQINPIKNAKEYIVQYAENPEMNDAFEVSSPTDTNITVTALNYNTRYYFKVKVVVKNKNTTYNLQSNYCQSYVVPDLDIIESWDISAFTPFAYENRYGITANPSYAYTWASDNFIDAQTGIIVNRYGDYMCAMGTYFGYCGDRFRITLDNGIWFTVQIGDSKGDVEYHPWGNNGCCYVEFIIDNQTAKNVANPAIFSGTYQSIEPFNGNIIKIEKIGKLS